MSDALNRMVTSMLQRAIDTHQHRLGVCPTIAAGLRGMIGKGYRGPAVREALVKYGAVHLAAPGGLGALLGIKITNSEILAYEDLGPEAIRRLVVADFPAVVAYDAHGGSIYDR